MTPTTLKKFLHRYTSYILSPLPLEETKKSPYLCSALLTYAKSLNDQAKLMKGACLSDNLLKARQGLAGFLKTAKDRDGRRYFTSKGQIWPLSHADLQKTVYSLAGIQQAVSSKIAVEFVSQKSPFKIAVNCPEDIFKIMLEISQIQQPRGNSSKTPMKKGKPEAAVASARNLREFTLNYCTHNELKVALEEVWGALLSNRKGVSFGQLTEKMRRKTSFIRMLNCIHQDLTNKEHPCEAFAKKIGPPNSEGFYSEDSYKRYPVLFYLTNL